MYNNIMRIIGDGVKMALSPKMYLLNEYIEKIV